jgi:hypothetical protein
MDIASHLNIRHMDTNAYMCKGRKREIKRENAEVWIYEAVLFSCFL